MCVYVCVFVCVSLSLSVCVCVCVYVWFVCLVLSVASKVLIAYIHSLCLYVACDVVSSVYLLAVTLTVAAAL